MRYNEITNEAATFDPKPVSSEEELMRRIKQEYGEVAIIKRFQPNSSIKYLLKGTTSIVGYRTPGGWDENSNAIPVAFYIGSNSGVPVRQLDVPRQTAPNISAVTKQTLSPTNTPAIVRPAASAKSSPAKGKTSSQSIEMKVANELFDELKNHPDGKSSPTTGVRQIETNEYVIEFRRWGTWVEVNYEDDVEMVPTQETIKQLSAVLKKYISRYPDFDFKYAAEEKEWLTIYVTKK